jgi:hypothetical protein
LWQAVFAPTPVVTIETFRRFAALNKKDFVALDITVRNPTAAVATITAAELELYSGSKPAGGLLGATTVSTTYSVETTDQAVIVQSNHDTLPLEATVIKPYSGNPYERLTLPLSQQIEREKSIALLSCCEPRGFSFRRTIPSNSSSSITATNLARRLP